MNPKGYKLIRGDPDNLCKGCAFFKDSQCSFTGVFGWEQDKDCGLTGKIDTIFIKYSVHDILKKL